MPDPTGPECRAPSELRDDLDGAVNESGKSRAGNGLEERLVQRVCELEAANAALGSELARQRRTEAELRRVIDTTPGIAYTYTAALPLRLTSMSGNSERLLGISASDLIGDAEAWARRVHPQDLERVLQTAARVLKDGSATNEYRYRHPDGSDRWICNTASLVRARDGSPIEVVGYSLDITESRLEGERERIRTMTEAKIDAQETERKRVSRELHDGVNQRLGLLILDIAEIERAPGLSSRVVRRLAALRAAAGDITDDIRKIAAQVYPVRLAQMGLEEALRHECACVSERAGIAVRFECGGLPEALDPGIAACLYRVAQESLQNIVRHSHARDGAMRLESVAAGLRLTVSDSGDGFDPAIPCAGLGVLSMRERVRLLEGAFSVDSAPGRGTRVEAWLPFAKETTF